MLRKIRRAFSGERQEEKRNLSVRASSNKGKDMADCIHHFGYLANRDKEAPIPQECIICLKVLRCIESNLT